MPVSTSSSQLIYDSLKAGGVRVISALNLLEHVPAQFVCPHTQLQLAPTHV